MTLAPGSQLGPYIIHGLLGRGGMGEVYRALDTRLDRTVAIKILPRQLADRHMRRLRFEREARAISALHHPNICALFDVGDYDGLPFLVMELLDGETLGTRLRRGPLPIREVLRHAIEIADALTHAHAARIIHRDLKPSNIVLTSTGVKLLDFGVIKLLAPDQVREGPSSVSDNTVTDDGRIVGTVPYMAPEQLEGRETDARSDLFALGAVLYEMVSGSRAFDITSEAGTLATMLGQEPRALVVPLPRRLEQTIWRCLAKDPQDRWQSAADLGQALRWIAEGDALPAAQSPAVVVSRRRPVRAAWMAAMVLVSACLGALALLQFRQHALPDPRSLRFLVFPPEHAIFSPSSAFAAVSPDGQTLAFVASHDGDNALWTRTLDSLATRQMPATEGASMPFWSADSRFIAFVSRGRLKSINVATGAVQALGPVPFGKAGTWNREGVILLNPAFEGGLYRMPATGGVLTPVTQLDPSLGETAHDWPQFLPDGRHFLFLALSTVPEHNRVLYVGSLDSPVRTRLLTGTSHARYAQPGALLFLRGHKLQIQPFDAVSLRLSGEATPIAEPVEHNVRTGRGAFSVSDAGVIAYRAPSETRLAWYDRRGRELDAVGEPGRYSDPVLSPDERQIAVARLDPKTAVSDIWLIDIKRQVPTRLTFEQASMPVWSPTGRRIAFWTANTLSWKAIDGTPSERLIDVDPSTVPLGWSPDGRLLLFAITAAVTRFDIWALPIAGDRRPLPLLTSSFVEAQAQVSPDGRWMAYVSDESGRHEVYVRAFPAGTEKWRVSSNGGLDPRWRRDGRELFYLSLDRTLMSVAIRVEPTVGIGATTPLFKTRMSALVSMLYYRNQYDVTRDGQRFVINQPSAETAPSPMTVVVNWSSALTQ